MPIEPTSIYWGVRKRDPDAEAELSAFLKNLAWRDYWRTLGPLAEDSLQELAMRVIQAIRENKISDPEKLIPFCKDVAANVRIDALRAAVRQARKLVPIDEARYQASVEDTGAKLLLVERLRTVLKLLERLDPLSRQVIRRYYFEHQEPATIETELNLTHLEMQRIKDEGIAKMRRDHRETVRRTDARGWQLLYGAKKTDREPDGFLALAVAA